MKIKTNHKITSLDELDIARRMRVDKRYYHCCGCGIIYEDKHKRIVVARLRQLIGRPSIPREFNKYSITSGFCEPCYEKGIEELNNKRLFK